MTPSNNSRMNTVKNRSQVFNPETGLWVRRDSATGLFIEKKENGAVFRGIRKESLNKIATTLNKLARYDRDK